MNNLIQLVGGSYTDGSEFVGFIDCSNYSLILEVSGEETATIKYQGVSYDNFLEFLDCSAYESKFLCRYILTSLVRQCFWTNLDFIKSIRAKLKILGANGEDINKYAESSISSYVSNLDTPIIDFTYNCLMTVCNEARDSKI